jgi:hypothetical protein
MFRKYITVGRHHFPTLCVPRKGKVKVEIKLNVFLVSAMKACGGVEV